MVTVYIFDNFYTVQEGDTLYFNKKHGKIGDRFIFFTEVGKPVIGTITDASETACSLGILMVDEKEEVMRAKAPKPTVEKPKEEMTEEKIEEVIEKPEVESQVDFDTLTKKELIAYIKDNNLPIETNKVNKATILEALKSL